MHVVSVSSSRADVSILGPVWKALSAQQDMRLSIFLTGMHRTDKALGVDTIPEGAQVHRGGADLGGAGDARAAAAMGAITSAAGKLYGEDRPDIVLVIGDRLDMLPAAVATLPFNIPLVHLHGGEVTEGAIDDRIRHSLSKLAHWHCVSSEGAKARLIALGEMADRITVTGAPGLDTLLVAPIMEKEVFLEHVGLPKGADFRLVTVHPETNAHDPLAPLAAVLAALEARPFSTLFTAPNSDPGGAQARRQIDAFVERYEWAAFVDSLGPKLYPNALRHAAHMLGNSSSGVVEAGLFGLPVIDVGARQKGRERGANVNDVGNEASAVIEALKKAASGPWRYTPGTPYGDGTAGPKIAAVFVKLPPEASLLAKPSLSRS